MRSWLSIPVVTAIAVWIGAMQPLTLPAAVGSNTVVRMEIDRGTNRLGTVDIELFDQDKPETVRNFLLYIRSGSYSNMFLHRLVPNFVVQGGGFAVTNPLAAVTNTAFLEITNFGRLTNEFSIGPRLTNRFGTVAMAKVGNDPNSATSQWFFNLGDNSANLDNQNGGFTVFGRVLETTNSTDGTNVLRHFNTLATSAGIVSLSGLAAFGELPVSYTNRSSAPSYRELYHTRMSVLGETNGPGTNAPTITITSPAPNARFTNQPVIVSGVASDDSAVARVLYRVQGGSSEIATGTNDWQVGLIPRPGFNTVSVESVDWDGRHSTNASVTFYYVSQLPLNLQTTGQGQVEGLTNGQLLQVGSAYAATAKPAKGYFFDGWSGSATSSNPALVFQVATNSTNVTLTASFTRDFFPILAGSYQGLIRETNSSTAPGLENTGFLTLGLNKRGGFSGKIRHRGGTYSFTGRFDRSGSTFLQGTFGGISRTITLRLNTTNSAGIITGSVSGSSSSSVEAALDRLATSAPYTNAPPAGDYPFSISPPNAAPGPLVPGGNGFGRIKITAKGALSLKGTLGDGTTIVASAKRTRAGRWPVYLNLLKGQSAVQGWIAGPSNQLSIVESRLTWMRTFNVAAATYPAGFSNQVTLTGMRLQPPNQGSRYLNWVTGLARLDGANLVLGVTNTVRLNVDNTLTIPEPNPSELRLNIDLSTGLVDGAFQHPWLGTTNLLHGVLFKPGESIRGQFRDGNQIGSFVINVAPFLSTQVLASVTLEGFLAAINDGGLIRFEGDGDITLPEPVRLPYDTALDANGHQVRFNGGLLTSLFVVPTNQSFAATGVTFADGRQFGANGADGATPQPGADACGAGVLNLGGTIAFTNCVFTNFVVQGGAAGLDTGTNGLLVAGGRALGAAICNRGGRATLQNCLLMDNLALAGTGASPPYTNRVIELGGAALGGAIFSDGPELLIQGSTFLRGEARGAAATLLPDGSSSQSGVVAGGALAALTGSLRLASNSFQTNMVVAASSLTNSSGAGLALGGAVFVESNVTAVIQVTSFTGNSATGGSAQQASTPGDVHGGALYNGGTAQFTSCTFEGNLARAGSSSPAGAARGGAIAALGALTVTNSTFHRNLAQGGLELGSNTNTPSGTAWGGAIAVIRSSFSSLNSTFALNQVLSGPEVNGALPGGQLPGERVGGAIATVSNSTALASITVAFNSAGSGGLPGVTNSGVAGGGGIANIGGAVSLRTSLLVSNASDNFRGSVTDVSYNFSSDASIALTPSTGLPATNANLLLGPLVNNGGPTWTMLLSLGSPARDKVPVNSLPALVDQRGVARPQPVAGFGDAGAAEAELTNAAPFFVPPPPASASVRVGTNVTFQATAVATNPIFYFWIKDGVPISNANNTIYTLPSVQVTNSGNYALVASNFFGVVTSAVATLTVDGRPLIVTEPTNLVVSPTANTSFFVGATPTAGLNYFWYHDGVRVGPNAATLPINGASPTNRGAYFVVVSNTFGVATSQVATLSFNSLGLQIAAQPSSVIVPQGQNATFTVTATGFTPPAYQWFFQGAPLPGQTNFTLVRTNVTAIDTGTYHVVVTNAYLSLTSAPATLGLSTSASPIFTLQPTGGVTRVGSNFTFQVAVAGTPPVDVFWLFGGVPLPGATGTSLVFTNLQTTNAGIYVAVATNAFGVSTSQLAALVVDATPRILIEPLDLIISPAADTNFVVVADGPDLRFAWYQDLLPLLDATNATLTISNAGPLARGGYRVVITNSYGAITSRLAQLTFDTNALAILTQPTNTIVTTGQVATFTVIAGGIPPFAYQWYFAGTGLTDATNNVLSLSNVDLTNAGNYRVVIANTYLSVTSVVATLTVDTNGIGPASISGGGPGPILSVRLTADRLIIECQGRPGLNCRLLRSASMPLPGPTATEWSEAASGTIPSSGPLIWVLPLPADRQLFFRATSP